MTKQGTYTDDQGNRMIISKPYDGIFRIRINGQSVQISKETLHEFLHVIDTQGEDDAGKTV